MKRSLLVGLISLALIAAVVLVLKWPRSVPLQFGCVTKTESIVATADRYMEGIIQPGKSYDALMGFYSCNRPQIGQVVLYRFSQTSDPVIRIVRAAGGDRFEVTQDKKHQSWNLKINNKLVEFNGEPYFFGGAARPTLSLYEKSRNHILGANEVIILSNVPPGSDDSGTFGLVDISDLIAKLK